MCAPLWIHLCEGYIFMAYIHKHQDYNADILHLWNCLCVATRMSLYLLQESSIFIITFMYIHIPCVSVQPLKHC